MDLCYWWIMLDNIWIDQMAANLWILWIITHSSKASIKWWPIDRSIKCPAQLIDRTDPSNGRDIYMYIYMSRTVGGFAQSIRLHNAIDGSINSCAINRCFTKMGNYP